MAVPDVSQIEILIGIFDLTVATIANTLGGKILARYKVKPEKSLIFVGFTFILASFPWVAGSISFILHVLFQIPFEEHIYLFLAQGIFPFALITWVYAFCLMFYQRRAKIVVPIYLTGIAIYEIFFIVILFTDLSRLGSFYAGYYLRPYPISGIFVLFGGLTVVVTLIIYVRESIRLGELKVKLKAFFLAIGISSLAIAIFLEGSITVTIVGIVLLRSLVISSAFEIYFGFFLPERIAKFFETSKREEKYNDGQVLEPIF